MILKNLQLSLFNNEKSVRFAYRQKENNQCKPTVHYTVKKIYEIPGFFFTKPSWDEEKSVLRRDYFRIFGPIQRKDFFCFEDVISVPLMEG
jgi:hypothetical protein